jgi:hypothetical protein
MSKTEDVMVGVPGIGAGVLIDTSKPAPVRIASAEEQEARLDELRAAFFTMVGFANGEVRDFVRALCDDTELGGQPRYHVRVPWGLKPGSARKVAQRFAAFVETYEAKLEAYKAASPIHLPEKGKDVARNDQGDDEGDE